MTSLAKALLPSSRAASADGPKHGMPAVAHRVGHARHQRRLRPDDDEVDPERDGERDHPGRVAHPAGQRLAAGDGLDAGVARCGDHGVDRRVERDGTDDGVLAGPGPDDEYLHATNLVARRGRAARASRHPRGRVPGPCGTGARTRIRLVSSVTSAAASEESLLRDRPTRACPRPHPTSPASSRSSRPTSTGSTPSSRRPAVAPPTSRPTAWRAAAPPAPVTSATRR